MIHRIITKFKDKKGFTLIELIVVIAILGILAGILIPQFTGFQEKAKSTQALVDAKQVATAADGLIAEGRTFTTSFTPSALEFNDAMIMELAGPDVPGTISGESVGDGHFWFTYTRIIDKKSYTIVRDSLSKSFMAV